MHGQEACATSCRNEGEHSLGRIVGAATMARILVAEDSQYIQYLLRQVLRDQGHQVYAAAEGQEALDTLERYPIELLLIDLRLPGLDGFQVIDRIHLQQRKIPFIVVSGYLDAETEVRLLKRGAARILSKPVDRALLAQAVERSLQPVRRILAATEEPPLLEPLQEQLERLGYQVEVQWQLDSIEPQVVYRTFDALVLWGEWVAGGEGIRLCRRLREREEWLPIFVPSRILRDDAGEGLELIAIAEDDPACDAFYTRLASRIGLQRNSCIGELALIQLAGSIDREDVLAEALREAVARRRNTLFDLRQATYLSPYVRKQLKQLDGQAQQFHLELGLLLNRTDAALSLEGCMNEKDSRYRIFT
ncbi:MAG TPA: response regulator, partial [Firmicutes bacterium]|nr:response regulator [Bacillota bacterium]